MAQLLHQSIENETFASGEADGDRAVAGDLAVGGGLKVEGGTVTLSGLPTEDPEVAGQLWSNSGVLTVSAGA